MPTVKKLCRVCGKSYEACRTAQRNVTRTFIWQEVACSPECGAEYLRRVNEARNPAPKPRKSSRSKTAAEHVAENVAEAVENTVAVAEDIAEA